MTNQKPRSDGDGERARVLVHEREPARDGAKPRKQRQDSYERPRELPAGRKMVHG